MSAIAKAEHRFISARWRYFRKIIIAGGILVLMNGCGGGDVTDESKGFSQGNQLDSESQRRVLASQPLGRKGAKAARELFGAPGAMDNIDLNGDGKSDLLWGNEATGETIAWLMNGTVLIGGGQLLRDPSYKVIGVGDFNGDGKTDLVWSSATARTTVIWLMDGNALIGSRTLPNDPNFAAVAAPDLNGDGRSDILWFNATAGQTVAWLMNGLNVIGDRLLLTDRDFRVIGLPDLNGDGKSDLIWYNSKSGQTISWLMDGASMIGNVQLLSHPTFKIIATPDFNGDGKSDLLWESEATGDTVAWLMNGNALVGGLTLLTDRAFRVTATPDLNGDGFDDLLWYSSASGQTVSWLMSGLRLVGSSPILTDRNFRVVGTSDLNGDGRSDLQWLGQSTAQNIAWIMNGNSLVSAGTLLTDPRYSLTQASAGLDRKVIVDAVRSNDGAISGDVAVFRSSAGRIFACGGSTAFMYQVDSQQLNALRPPSVNYGVGLHELPGLKNRNIQKVVATNLGFYALDSQGSVWGWGSNTSRKLHDGSTEDRVRVPILSSGSLRDIVDIASGVNHVLFLDRFGNVYSRGTTNFGARGLDSRNSIETITQVPGLPQILWITAGSDFSAALDVDGNVWTWGNNSRGALGRGIYGVSEWRPAMVSLPGTRVRRIFSSYNGNAIYAVAAGLTDRVGADSLSSASVYAWGSNYFGTLSRLDIRTTLDAAGSSVQPVTPLTRIGLQPHLAQELVPTSEYVVSLSAPGQLSFWGWTLSSLANGTPTLFSSTPLEGGSRHMVQAYLQTPVVTKLIAADNLALSVRVGGVGYIRGNGGVVEPCVGRRLSIAEGSQAHSVVSLN